MTAELCGHRWLDIEGICVAWEWHRCDEPAAHHPAPCTCRCGATTTRPEGER